MSKYIKPPGWNWVLSLAWEGRKFTSTLGRTLSGLHSYVTGRASHWLLEKWILVSIEYDIWLVCNISDCVLYAFKAWSIPEFSQEGTHESHLITKSSLDSCCLFRRIFTASLEWALSDADPQKHCKARQASDFPKSWIPLSVKPWIRLASVKTSQRRNEFLLSAALPLAFQSWEKVEVELVKRRHEGCIEAVRSPGSASSHTKQSSKISLIS